MSKTITGLEILTQDKDWQKKVKGNIGYLCHSASIDSKFQIGVKSIQNIFGERLKALFGPQHGFVCDVQDNMIETDNFEHPYFKVPVYSLYGETRIPTDEMLNGIDTLIVDLQDVGTRVYTYISTLSLLMKACEDKDILIMVLDRPNPVGGNLIEGNILEKEWESFVGMYDIPMRHAMTMGEVANYAKKYQSPNCNLEVIPMKNWKRSMFWEDTSLPWINASPNLSTPESCTTFCGTVMLEGTNLSEGRGTTRALEVIGHPDIEPYSLQSKLEEMFSDFGITGVEIRPIVFHPMFQKFEGTPCGGFHFHPTDNSNFKSWRAGQVAIKFFREILGDKFEWNNAPYEYQFEKLAIDFINGSEKVRQWIEQSSDLTVLETIELAGHDDYLNRRADCLIYS